MKKTKYIIRNLTIIAITLMVVLLLPSAVYADVEENDLFNSADMLRLYTDNFSTSSNTSGTVYTNNIRLTSFPTTKRTVIAFELTYSQDALTHPSNYANFFDLSNLKVTLNTSANDSIVSDALIVFRYDNKLICLFNNPYTGSSAPSYYSLRFYSKNNVQQSTATTQTTLPSGGITSSSFIGPFIRVQYAYQTTTLLPDSLQLNIMLYKIYRRLGASTGSGGSVDISELLEYLETIQSIDEDLYSALLQYIPSIVDDVSSMEALMTTIKNDLASVKSSLTTTNRHLQNIYMTVLDIFYAMGEYNQGTNNSIQDYWYDDFLLPSGDYMIDWGNGIIDNTNLDITTPEYTNFMTTSTASFNGVLGTFFNAMPMVWTLLLVGSVLILVKRLLA